MCGRGREETGKRGGRLAEAVYRFARRQRRADRRKLARAGEEGKKDMREE